MAMAFIPSSQHNNIFKPIAGGSNENTNTISVKLKELKYHDQSNI
jgi:hypothetical protein